MVKWYCKIKGTVLGPFSEQELTLMVEKGKIRPGHPVKVENAMEWSKARDIPLVAHLFTDDELAEDDEREAERQARKKKRERADNVGYYGALGRDLRYGGEWLAILLKTVGIYAVLAGILALIAGRNAGMVIPLVIFGLLTATVGLVLGLMFDAAVLRLPTLLLSKDWRHIEVMEVFAATYFYMLIANLFIGVVLITNPRAGAGLANALPFLAGGILAYLVCTRWDIKLWLAVILAIIYVMIWFARLLGIMVALALVIRSVR
jgi:hypothetical protein